MMLVLIHFSWLKYFVLFKNKIQKKNAYKSFDIIDTHTISCVIHNCRLKQTERNIKKDGTNFVGKKIYIIFCSIIYSLDWISVGFSFSFDKLWEYYVSYNNRNPFGMNQLRVNANERDGRIIKKKKGDVRLIITQWIWNHKWE